MTLTASPSTAATIDRAAFGDLANDAESILGSVDHRRIGRWMTGFSLLFGVGAFVLWALVSQRFDALLRGAVGDSDFLGIDPQGGFSVYRIASGAQTALPYFVVIPLFLGVATATVPGLIGARRLAFPRLASFVLYGYLVSAGLFIAAFAAVDGPPLLNIISTSVPQGGARANQATDLLLGSLILVTLVSLLGALNIAITVATQRPVGQRFDRIRPFAFASFVTSGILLITLPVFLAGLALLEIDQHFGGSLFSLEAAGRVWSQMIWLNGRPEALLLVLPAIGALIEVVAARTNTSPAGGITANALFGAYGVLTLLAWASDPVKLSRVVQPNSSWVTCLVGLPLGLLMLVSLGTFAGGIKNLKADVSLLFAVGAELLILAAVANMIVAAIRGVTSDGGKEIWSTSQTHTLIVAAPILGLLAAAVELMGANRRTPKAPASLGAFAVLVGSLLWLVGTAALGYQDNFDSARPALSTLSLVGSLAVALGLAITGLSLASTALSSRSNASENLH